MTPRIPHLIAGSLTGVLAAGTLALGGGLLWLDSEKDADGYLNTGKQEYRAAGAALVSDNLDVDLDGAEFMFDADDDFGTVRLNVEPESGGKPVFVGIAKTEDVDRYLSRVNHTTVKDVEYSPFEPTYAEHLGGRDRAAPPGEQRFWEAKTTGAGEQTLTWDVGEGDWSAVVMNADGSAGISTDVDAGAKIDYIDEIGWSSLGTGTGLTLVAGTLLILAFRPRRRGGAIGDPAPVTA